MKSDTSPFGLRGFLIDAPQFGTLRGRPNGAVLIDNGKISKIGDYEELRRLHPNSIRWLDRRPAAIFPGLIDCHTHLRNTRSWPAVKATCCHGCGSTFFRLSGSLPDRKLAPKRPRFFKSWCAMAPPR